MAWGEIYERIVFCFSRLEAGSCKLDRGLGFVVIIAVAEYEAVCGVLTVLISKRHIMCIFVPLSRLCCIFGKAGSWKKLRVGIRIRIRLGTRFGWQGTKRRSEEEGMMMMMILFNV